MNTDHIAEVVKILFDNGFEFYLPNGDRVWDAGEKHPDCDSADKVMVCRSLMLKDAVDVVVTALKNATAKDCCAMDQKSLVLLRDKLAESGCEMTLEKLAEFTKDVREMTPDEMMGKAYFPGEEVFVKKE